MQGAFSGPLRKMIDWRWANVPLTSLVSIWIRPARGQRGSGSWRRMMVPMTEWHQDKMAGDEFDGITMLRIWVYTPSSAFKGLTPVLLIVITCIRSLICVLGLQWVLSNKNLIEVEAIMKSFPAALTRVFRSKEEGVQGGGSNSGRATSTACEDNPWVRYLWTSLSTIELSMSCSRYSWWDL